MPQKDPNRTETATPKRREKAREEGNVPKSDEISKVVVLLAGILVMRFMVGHVGGHLEEVFAWSLGNDFDFELTPNNLQHLLVFGLQKIVLMLWPLLFFLVLASFLVVRLQVGHLFSIKVFKPKMEKFNVFKGLQKIFFSLSSAVNAIRSIFQVGTVALVSYLIISARYEALFELPYHNVQGIMHHVLRIGFELMLLAIIPLLIIAILHFFYTRWDYEENLKMTKDEVKDEQKQSYGNPEVKKAQRKQMMEVMQKRMMADVPQADVVVTNPTSLAVALRYDPGEAPAPLVVAKGSGAVAEKIKEVAREHNIPLREDKPLAQALYKSVEVGQTIPEELYQAVASVLAQLYKFKTRRS
ncbi:MAG: flagellar biosynthesis protein FlhB [Thermodesulfobacteriota bacterium]